VVEKATVLEEKVKLGSVLHASNIRMVPIDLRRRGTKERETERARRVDPGIVTPGPLPGRRRRVRRRCRRGWVLRRHSTRGSGIVWYFLTHSLKGGRLCIIFGQRYSLAKGQNSL
jgi:hypothetical protein